MFLYSGRGRRSLKAPIQPDWYSGEENAPRVLLLFEHSNGNQIFGKVSIHDLGKCNPRVSLLFEHSNKNQVALKIFAKVSIHDLGELVVFSRARVKDRF